MKQTVNFSDFRDVFQAIRPDNFSYEGQRALFNYLEQLEEDIGVEIELYVIALCVDYAEYTLDELNQEYSSYNDIEWDSIDDAINWLIDHTTVIRVNSDIVIIASF